jgi:hypothetical protein
MATRVKITSRYPTDAEIAEITRIPNARAERLRETQQEVRRHLLAKKMKAATQESDRTNKAAKKK